MTKTEEKQKYFYIFISFIVQVMVVAIVIANSLNTNQECVTMYAGDQTDTKIQEITDTGANTLVDQGFSNIIKVGSRDANSILYVASIGICKVVIEYSYYTNNFYWTPEDETGTGIGIISILNPTPDKLRDNPNPKYKEAFAHCDIPPSNSTGEVKTS